jgi:hypothetical protein
MAPALPLRQAADLEQQSPATLSRLLTGLLVRETKSDASEPRHAAGPSSLGEGDRAIRRRRPQTVAIPSSPTPSHDAT